MNENTNPACTHNLQKPELQPVGPKLANWVWTQVVGCSDQLLQNKVCDLITPSMRDLDYRGE